MKTVILTAISALTFGTALGAAADNKMAQPIPSLKVSNFDLKKTGDRLLINMTLDPEGKKVATNRETLYTPMLVNGTDTLRLNSFTIAGRNRYYSHLRADDNALSSIYYAADLKEPLVCRAEVPFRKWMETATVQVEEQERGCCSYNKGTFFVPVAQIDLVPRTYDPAVNYVTPKAEAVKERSISARAYIDFPVNKTQIYPDYRRNPEELKKIIGTIDSVRNDENLTIKTIHIKGYASPEGSYQANEKLAQGRTLTLADYVRNLYKFKRDVMTTSFEAEDWAGLEEYVKSEAAQRTLTDPAGILAIINNPEYKGKDDAREAAIKTQFPKDYQFLLAEVYPGLRHSDYAVNFIVRSFQTPEEIGKIMKTAPQNLSLSELFVYANSLTPGSKEYNETFELAVKLYPDDPVANLNAGSAALMRGDIAEASGYLAKAGNSDEAQYARGVLAAMQKDYAKAASIFRALPPTPDVKKALEQIDNINKLAEGQYKLLNDKI